MLFTAHIHASRWSRGPDSRVRFRQEVERQPASNRGSFACKGSRMSTREVAPRSFAWKRQLAKGAWED